MHDERGRDDVERVIGEIESLDTAVMQVDHEPILDRLAARPREQPLGRFDASDPSGIADTVLRLYGLGARATTDVEDRITRLDTDEIQRSFAELGLASPHDE